MLNGVGNTIANIPSFLVPYLALGSRKRFRGSFMPLYLLSAALKLGAAVGFLVYGAVTPPPHPDVSFVKPRSSSSRSKSKSKMTKRREQRQVCVLRSQFVP